jgi:hypothetical protein
MAYVFWSAVPGVTGYILERRNAFMSTSTLDYRNISLSLTTAFIDRTVVPGKTYIYSVRAIKGSVSSLPKVSTPITIRR